MCSEFQKIVKEILQSNIGYTRWDAEPSDGTQWDSQPRAVYRNTRKDPFWCFGAENRVRFQGIDYQFLSLYYSWLKEAAQVDLRMAGGT